MQLSKDVVQHGQYGREIDNFPARRGCLPRCPMLSTQAERCSVKSRWIDPKAHPWPVQHPRRSAGCQGQGPPECSGPLRPASRGKGMQCRKKSLMVSSALEAMLRAASFSALPIAPMPLIKPLIMSLPSCTQSTFFDSVPKGAAGVPCSADDIRRGVPDALYQIDHKVEACRDDFRQVGNNGLQQGSNYGGRTADDGRQHGK